MREGSATTEEDLTGIHSIYTLHLMLVSNLSGTLER